MRLSEHHYGKARVRVMKVSRSGAEHNLKELEVAVMLRGDFDASYTRANNALVVPTDTMKNTVYVLAKDKLGTENEEFGAALGQHFLATYPQIDEVEIRLAERGWTRLEAHGKPHPHSFAQNQSARSIATVTSSRDGVQVESGIQDLLILKSTGSGFAGFLKDRYTTLPETTDRIFATRLKATWPYARKPASYAATNRKLLEVMLAVFAGNYSVSVQATLFEMGQAALEAAPEISKISLAMPNQHCLLVNLKPFGLDNQNEIFVPTDEPHGQIEGTVSRD